MIVTDKFLPRPADLTVQRSVLSFVEVDADIFQMGAPSTPVHRQRHRVTGVRRRLVVRPQLSDMIGQVGRQTENKVAVLGGVREDRLMQHA